MLKCSPEYALSRRHPQAARRRVCFHLITALAHWEARGIIACVICNKREDPISTTTILMCTLRISLCKSWTHAAIHTNITINWTIAQFLKDIQNRSRHTKHSSNEQQFPFQVDHNLTLHSQFPHSPINPINKASVVRANVATRNQYRDHSLKTKTTSRDWLSSAPGLGRRWL